MRLRCGRALRRAGLRALHAQRLPSFRARSHEVRVRVPFPDSALILAEGHVRLPGNATLDTPGILSSKLQVVGEDDQSLASR